MLGDIGIVVFALIGIFAKKRWAAITATIWFIVGIFLVLLQNAYYIYDFGPQINEDFATVIVIIQIGLIIGAWIRSKKN
jgi:hypothetical protein